jgi:hypothetical protein
MVNVTGFWIESATTTSRPVIVSGPPLSTTVATVQATYVSVEVAVMVPPVPVPSGVPVMGPDAPTDPPCGHGAVALTVDEPDGRLEIDVSRAFVTAIDAVPSAVTSAACSACVIGGAVGVVIELVEEPHAVIAPEASTAITTLKNRGMTVPQSPCRVRAVDDAPLARPRGRAISVEVVVQRLKTRSDRLSVRRGIPPVQGYREVERWSARSARTSPVRYTQRGRPVGEGADATIVLPVAL